MTRSALLVIDKPAGMSSHDVVAKARRLFHQQRVGHTGTLDPLATGVLVICFGQATRLSEYLLGEDKSYVALARLGIRTTTDDCEGEVLYTKPVPALTEETLRALEQRFSGEVQQVPPQFSAIKRDGQRAYALARRGERVALEPRQVTIHSLRLRLVAPDRLEMEVSCSAGTYIRALARDIGEALGCGAHLESLRRTRSGAFTLAHALTINQLQDMDESAREACLLPMDAALSHLPAVHLPDEQARKLQQGQRLSLTDSATKGLCRVYDAQGRFCAIGRITDTGTLLPEKVFDANRACA